MAPSITLSPTTGLVGTEVLITGTGFADLSAVTFTYGGSSISPVEGSIETNGSGAFTAHIIVPASVAGVSAVVATDASEGTNSQNFTVTPSLTLNPTSGPAGTGVYLTGAGFGNAAVVTISLNSQDLSTDPTTITTSSSGAFTGEAALPNNLSPVSSTIVATDADSNTASATFTVISQAFPWIPINGFSQQQKYQYAENVPYTIEADSTYSDLQLFDVRNLSEIFLAFYNNGSNSITISIYGIVHESDNNPPPTDEVGILAWTELVTNQAIAALAHYDWSEAPSLYSWLCVQVKSTSGSTILLSAKSS